MKVSILINAYNAERYLAETLDSALAQTYRDIEIIVLDDHSTDRTADIVRSYVARDSRVRYLLPATRLGLIEGRNELLRAASGEFFTYLDSDDIYLPEKVAEEVSFLRSHPEFAAVYCDLRYFYDGAPETLYRHRYTFYSGDEVFPQLLEKMFITNTTVMFRRELYDELGGYRTDLGIVEDHEFFLRMTYAGYRIAFLPSDLVRYRLRWDSHTNFKQQVLVQESAVNIFIDLREHMSIEDRTTYRIDYWIAKRKETYAIALAAAGQGNEARQILHEAAPHVALAKRAAILFLSVLPASVAGFVVEQLWNRKKRNHFVKV